MKLTNAFLVKSLGWPFEVIGVAPHDVFPIALHLLLALTSMAALWFVWSERTNLRAGLRLHMLPLCGLTIAGTGLHLALVVRQFRWFVDEPWLIEQAKVLVTGESYSWFPFQQNIGWPYLLSFGFRMCGVSSVVPLCFADVFAIATLLATYLVAYALFGKRELGVYAAIILGLAPLHLHYSGTATSMIPGMFMGLLGILFTVRSVSCRPLPNATLVMTILVYAWAILTRIETIALFGPAAMVIWIRRRSDAAPHARLLACVTTAGAAILLFPSLYITLNYYFSDELTGARGKTDTFSLSHGFENLRLAAGYALHHKRAPSLVVIGLALAGYLQAAFARRAAGYSLIAWTAVLAAEYTFYFTFDERWILFLLPPIAVAAGLSLSRLHAWRGPRIGTVALITAGSVILASHHNLPAVMRSSVNPNSAFYTSLPARLEAGFPDPETAFIFYHPLYLKMLSQRTVISTHDFLNGTDAPAKRYVYVSITKDSAADSMDGDPLARETIALAAMRTRYHLGDPIVLSWNFTVREDHLRNLEPLSPYLNFTDREVDTASGVRRIQLDVGCMPVLR